MRPTAAAMLVLLTAWFSPDQATLLYGSGGSSGAATLKALPIAPGAPVTLDTSAGAVHVFAAY